MATDKTGDYHWERTRTGRRRSHLYMNRSPWWSLCAKAKADGADMLKPDELTVHGQPSIGNVCEACMRDYATLKRGAILGERVQEVGLDGEREGSYREGER